jgi:ADP-heptose:LPS heptosyltransferase
LANVGFAVETLGDNLDRDGAMLDRAAIIKNLDLVIGADTGLVHMAGALAAPTWVALPFSPDWRWLLDRTDSPWYPTVRLFRQRRHLDWSGVFEEMAAQLAPLAAAKLASAGGGSEAPRT